MKTTVIENQYFTELNATTKKALALVDSFNMSDFTDTELFHVYGRYSESKEHAMDYCKTLQAKFDGYNGHITSHNCDFFAYAFKFMYEGVERLAYITACNNYLVTL